MVTIAGPVTGYYDANGRWLTGQPGGYRDANGVWIADAQPGYYNANGRWIAGQAVGYYDAQGRWIATSPSAADRGADVVYEGRSNWGDAGPGVALTNCYPEIYGLRQRCDESSRAGRAEPDRP